MHGFTVWAPLLGGALIGAAATWLYASRSRVAGVSGMLHRAVSPDGESRDVDASFLAGLALAGAALRALWPGAFGGPVTAGFAEVVVAGLLVGVGTRLANGCTSGHGVCGVSRLAPRSLAATATFMLLGGVTALVARHAHGGLR